MIPARIAALALSLTLVAACQKNDLTQPPVPLGNFALGLNIVVVDKMQKVPISRTATPEEWQAALKKAIQDRFGRYAETGTKFYNLGISIDAYALAPPGVPVVLKPRSALVITANVWDDAAEKKLNAEGKQITVFEGTTGKTFIGSGLTQTKEQQMAILSYNAAKAVEKWLLDNPEWIGLPPKPPQEEPAEDGRGARRAKAAPETAPAVPAAAVGAAAGTAAPVPVLPAPPASGAAAGAPAVAVTPLVPATP